MASPQIENGYSPISNELLEQVYKLKLNGTQYSIILVIWRYTYGFSRKQHDLSETFIAHATVTHKKQISRELNNLIKLKIVTVLKEATFTTPRIISFNKNYSEWVQNSIQGANKLPLNDLDGGTGSELATSTGSGLVTQDNQLKQNINQSGATLFCSFWNVYPKKNAKASAQKAFSKLKVNESLLTLMILSLERQKLSKQWQDVTYIPYASTWLNQRRWEDETKEMHNDILTITAAGTFKF